MTLTLELSDDVLQRLNALAEQQHKTPEAVALALLNEKLQKAAEAEELDDETFQQLARSVIEDNRELLERLAR